MSFADKLQLALLCDELHDTNTVIENAEQEAKADIWQLEKDAKAMKEEAESFSHTIADNRLPLKFMAFLVRLSNLLFPL